MKQTIKEKLIKTVVREYCNAEFFEPFDVKSIEEKLQTKLDNVFQFGAVVQSMKQVDYKTTFKISYLDDDDIIKIIDFSINKSNKSYMEDYKRNIATVNVVGRTVDDILIDIKNAMLKEDVSSIQSEDNYVLVEWNDENYNISIPSVGKNWVYEEELFEEDTAHDYIRKVELNEQGYPASVSYRGEIDARYEHDELGRPIRKIEYGNPNVGPYISETWEYDEYNGQDLAVNYGSGEFPRVYGINFEATYSEDDDFINRDEEFLKDYYYERIR